MRVILHDKSIQFDLAIVRASFASKIVCAQMKFSETIQTDRRARDALAKIFRFAAILVRSARSEQLEANFVIGRPGSRLALPASGGCGLDPGAHRSWRTGMRSARSERVEAHSLRSARRPADKPRLSTSNLVDSDANPGQDLMHAHAAPRILVNCLHLRIKEHGDQREKYDRYR